MNALSRVLVIGLTWLAPHPAAWAGGDLCGDGVATGLEACDWGVAGALLDLHTSTAELASFGGLALAGDTLYVADPVRGGVHRVDAATGVWIDYFVDAQGAGVVDVAAGPADALYVVARDSHRIEIYSRATGAFFSAMPIGGGLLRPEAVAFREGEAVAWVASGRDDGAALQPVRRVSLDSGALLGTFGAAVGERALRFGPDGHLYTAVGATVRRWDGLTGDALGVAVDAGEIFDAVTGFTFADGGAVFVVGTGDGPARLGHFASDGALVGVFGAGAVGPGSGLVVDDDGRLRGPGVDLTPGHVVGVARFLTGNSDTAADACRTDCTLARCGDGTLDGGEGCDIGDAAPGSGCTGCEPDPGWVCDTGVTPSVCYDTCGDGVRDPHEGCDDGGVEGGDGCSGECAVEVGWACAEADPLAPSTCGAAACGDGIIAGDEACDDGDDGAGDGCTACEVDDGWRCDPATSPSLCARTCGDGLLDLDEACDDGDGDAGDGCSGCAIEAGWVCDLGATPTVCFATCGDGSPDPHEQCDDGGVEDGDGCSATCAVETEWSCSAAAQSAPSTCAPAGCGDGVLGPHEACDDGDTEDGDGCSASCSVELGWVCAGEPSSCGAEACGDGVVAGLEGCDDGGVEGGDGCSAACEVEPGWTCDGGACAPASCGDGIAVGSEECDDGGAEGGDGCDADCGVEPGWACLGGGACAPAACGDGVAVGPEECDDANTEDGDGCDAGCAIEAGWSCEPGSAPSVCATTCGDGLVRGDEGCDDGDVEAGDGCDGACEVEDGWTCPLEATPCEPICGDGLTRGDEACDDGDDEEGDGCHGCEIEGGWSCGPGDDGASVCVPDEACGDGLLGAEEGCDDGGTVPGDGCDAACEVEAGWSCTAAGCVPVVAPPEVEPVPALFGGEGCAGGGAPGSALVFALALAALALRRRAGEHPRRVRMNWSSDAPVERPPACGPGAASGAGAWHEDC